MRKSISIVIFSMFMIQSALGETTGVIPVTPAIEAGSSSAGLGVGTANTEIELRDPFQKPFVGGKDLKELPNSKATPKAELEKYSVDQIKVLAILMGLNQPRAMISAPGGKIFYITEKTKIGLRNGVVRKISTDSVLIREKFVNTIGTNEVLDTELKLADETAEKKASESGNFPTGYSGTYPAPYPGGVGYPAPYSGGAR